LLFTQGIDGRDYELPRRLDHSTNRVFVEEVDSAVCVDRGCRVIALRTASTHISCVQAEVSAKLR
jgi:hypothetical protein